jgi:hypothetical protein
MNPAGMHGNRNTSTSGDIIHNEMMLAEVFKVVLRLTDSPLPAQVEAFKGSEAFARYTGFGGDAATGDLRALAQGFKFWCEQMQISLPENPPRRTAHPGGSPHGIDADPATTLEFYVAQEAVSDAEVQLARKALSAARTTAGWGMNPGDGVLDFLNSASRWELSTLYARRHDSAPPYVDPVGPQGVMVDSVPEFDDEALQSARALLQPSGRSRAEEWLSQPVVLALAGAFRSSRPGEPQIAEPQAVPAYDRNGILHRLCELSTSVARRYRWSQPDSMGFIAFGLVPALSGAGDALISTEPHALRALSRIQMEIDPRVSPLEVRKLYEIERQKLLKNDRDKSLKHTYLGFFWGMPETQALPTRLAQVEAWNALTTDWGLPIDYEYPATPQGITNFARDARAARLRILHFGRAQG